MSDSIKQEFIKEDWFNYQELFKEEFEYRSKIKPLELCDYGIIALNDPLIAIAKDELVVIGADTGSGKSTLGLQLAQHNSKKGKKVALYYLEGGHLEAIARMKWKDICEEYYKNYKGAGIEMDYRKWSLNKFNSQEEEYILKEIEDKQYKKWKDVYKDNLMIYKIERDFTKEKLLMSILSFHDLLVKNDSGNLDLDLIVIDHLQYFSLTRPEREIFEITEILREVKTMTEKWHVPVVLISHLRKKSKDRGLPGNEDFYGTSNISKIANTAIIVSSCTKEEDIKNNIYVTALRITKSRIGLRQNYCMLVKYFLNESRYDDKYLLCKLDNFGNILNEEGLDYEELPKWAKENYENIHGKGIRYTYNKKQRNEPH